MHWIDWVIVIVPLLIVVGVSLYSRKYVTGVVDYLAAGRVAGRYVLTVGDMTAGLGIITLVALVEAFYQTGSAVNFWATISAPVGLFFGLTGFCIYRFRESKALSNGQFLEMRYSRSFRIIASFTRLIAEMLTNAIGPAVAANFFIYFLGLPHKIMVLGYAIPTFSLIVGLVLILALALILPAGRISLIITDCVQGLFCYPVFLLIAVYIIYKFAWYGDVAPVMSNRVSGESFLDPFDVSQLRDFNLFALIVAMIGNNYNRAAYAGNDSTSAGRTPHEQKMASILASWRSGFAFVMCGLIAITTVGFMNQPKYGEQAHEVRQELCNKVAAEVVTSPQMLSTVNSSVGAIAVPDYQIGRDTPLSQKKNLDTGYLNAAQKAIGDTPEGNQMFQRFKTLYNQMMMPMSFRKILPVGMMGVFCLMAIMLMVTTDDGRIFNASSAIIQDLVVPFQKEAMSPEKHLKYVKWCTVFVVLFFFAGSLLFAQMDYINMFIQIMVSIWLGAAGPIMVFGLYSRFGNTIGAYSALVFGSGVSVCAVFLQRNWADYFYPLFERHDLVGPIGKFMEVVTAPFNPFIVWEMNPIKCPINSYEFWFIAMVLGTIAYVVGSLVTYKGAYNLERLLHRGKYNTDGVGNIESAWTWKSMWGKLIGITPDYTRGDKVIVWSIFIYTFGYQIGFCFVGVLIWYYFHKWPIEWWSNYFFINTYIVGPVVGFITTIWFLWGGAIDIFRLFRDLSRRKNNPLDDGRVEGHVSVSDIAVLGKDENGD